VDFLILDPRVNPSWPIMEYIKHLCKDAKLRKIIRVHPPVKLAQRKEVFMYLSRSIMSQQLSTQVARVIEMRFLNLYAGNPTAKQILETEFDTLRAIGLSRAKTSYLQNVARFAIQEGLNFRTLNQMSNEEVVAYLTQIKGVGRWTAEMLLMFSLGREDVFAVDDLGISQAMMKLYKLDNSDRKKFRQDLLGIAEKWSPYRTYACVHLWKWKDKKQEK
jgi:DNA-3-methyladenine glycosylase II